MKDKVSLAIGLVVVAAVIVTLGVYMLAVPEINVGTLMTPLIVIVLVALAFWVLRDRAKSIKQGLPAQDEMSRKIWHKSGYYAWLVTIYICLGLSWANEILMEDFGFGGLIARHMAFAILALSALTFFILYFWFSRKGNV